MNQLVTTESDGLKDGDAMVNEIQQLIEQPEQRLFHEEEELSAIWEAHDNEAKEYEKLINLWTELQDEGLIGDANHDANNRVEDHARFRNLDKDAIGTNDKAHNNNRINPTNNTMLPDISSEGSSMDNGVQDSGLAENKQGEVSEVDSKGQRLSSEEYNLSIPGKRQAITNQVEAAGNIRTGIKRKVETNRGDGENKVYTGGPIITPQWSELITTDKASVNDGVGMIYGSQGALQSECSEGDPGQMTDDNGPDYAGQRDNGAAIGTGDISRPSQVRDTKTESIRSEAEMEYDGHKLQKLSGIFGFNGPGYERMNRGLDD